MTVWPSKERKEDRIDICANCVSASRTLNEEFVVCTNEDSDHCAHILAFEHKACKLFKTYEKVID